MKHCIVDKQSQLILFKVADELVEEFENGHKDQAIARVPVSRKRFWNLSGWMTGGWI